MGSDPHGSEGVPAMKLVGLSGSLRRASYNSALLRAAAAAVPEGSKELGSPDTPFLKQLNGGRDESPVRFAMRS